MTDLGEAEQYDQREKDVNLRLILLAYQKKKREDERRQRESKRKPKKKARPTKRKHIERQSEDEMPVKRKKTDEVSEDERDEEMIDEDIDISDEEEKTSTDYLNEVRTEEESRIDQMIEQRRAEEGEQKDMLLDFCRNGLVSSCSIIDREIGYDGSFGTMIGNDPLANRLLKYKIYSSASVRSYVSVLKDYGIFGYVALKFIEARPGIISDLWSMFKLDPDFGLETKKKADDTTPP